MIAEVIIETMVCVCVCVYNPVCKRVCVSVCVFAYVFVCVDSQYLKLIIPVCQLLRELIKIILIHQLLQICLTTHL